MNVIDFEGKIGKHWRLWSPDERREFVKLFTGDEPVYPLIWNLVCENVDVAPDVLEAKWELEPGTFAKMRQIKADKDLLGLVKEMQETVAKAGIR